MVIGAVVVSIASIAMVAVRFVAALWVARDGLPAATARAIRSAQKRQRANLNAVLPPQRILFSPAPASSQTPRLPSIPRDRRAGAGDFSEGGKP